jgi:hypothetical protein
MRGFFASLRMTSFRGRPEDDLRSADFEDAGAEFFYFLVAETVDGFELREGLRTSEDDASQGGGGEDEEEREV